MDIQKEKIAHEKHLLSQGVDFKYLPNIQYNELENIYELIEWDEEYSEALNEINSSWCTWQAAKAQAVQSKQDLLDRVNARWQLAHEQCAENWNTYSSAQMDAFDWIEQDIEELLGEAQEQAND